MTIQPFDMEYPVPLVRLARGFAALTAVVFLVAFSIPAAAGPTITLEEAAERKPPDFTPLHEGRAVVVTGQVSGKPVRLTGFLHLAIQERGRGMVLEGSGAIFDQITPGDWVEAQGRIAKRGGLPVVVVSKIATVASGAPPLPVSLGLEQVQSLERLGLLVVTEGPVIEVGANFGGSYLRLGTPPESLKVFLPGSQSKPRSFAGFAPGEWVRVTGIAYQYAPAPPHIDQFELLVGDAQNLVRLSAAWPPQVRALWPILVALAALGFLWWRREVAAKRQRKLLRTIYHLGEEILGAASSPEILNRISLVLPKVLNVTGAQLYLHDRGTKTLNQVSDQAAPIALDSPAGLVQTSAAACFQNRIGISIPDTRRHPFQTGGQEEQSLPRSILFVPMQAQGEPIGVLQVDNNRHARHFSADEQAVAQHLANQIGLAVKLLQQRSFREQLSRSEKLAAVGRLISGVVNDLQTPLEAISSMADSALQQHTGSAPGHELLVIASEARRATALVSRLVSFAQPEQVQAEPVQLNQLLRNLIKFREREWKSCGIQLENLMKDKPLYVLGSEGQLEQVFLNLFVHAEQSLEDALEKRITIRADVLAKRVFVEIGYSAALQRAPAADGHPPAAAQGEVGGLGLDICRSIVAGHGGELRITTAERQSIFEIELPGVPAGQTIVKAPPAEPSRPTRRWTALMLEPEEFVERRLVEWLANRGYRVVPVRSSEEGLDLVQRMRFDVVFCSTHLIGLNWVEFFDRVRGRVSAFALLAEAFSQDLSTHFRGEGRYVLHKPIEQSQFDRTLAAIETRLQSAEIATPEVESY